MIPGHPVPKAQGHVPDKTTFVAGKLKFKEPAPGRCEATSHPCSLLEVPTCTHGSDIIGRVRPEAVPQVHGTGARPRKGTMRASAL